MNKEEIRKLIWDWETFACKKNYLSINEEVLSEWIDEFLKPKENDLNPLASKPFKIQEDSSYKLYNNDNDNSNN